MLDDEALTFPLSATPYSVAFTSGPPTTVSGTNVYLDPDFVVFTDADGSVTAAYPAHTILSIVPAPVTAPTGGTA